MTPTEKPEDRELAWIGDAALTLVVREWILDVRGTMDGEIHKQITSNRFLRVFGHPTMVEANLGRMFQSRGLDAVREHFQQVILPEYRGRFPVTQDS